MIKLIKNLSFIFIILLSYFTYLCANEKSVKFIALGHIYPIIDDEKRMNSLFKKINSYDSDYVFILGDAKLYSKKYYEYLKKNINSKTFFSPGNHDISGKKIENYKNNIGYLNKQIKDENIKFLLLNSSQDKNDMIKFLKENLSENFNGITIILTHHRIWDDTLIGPKPFSHDKSFYFEEIYPVIREKVNFIFAGNSKRQHFRDLTDDEITYGKQNVNLIYWLDKIGKINLYSIGMGDGKPKATFIVADVIEDDLYIKGDYSTIEKYDVLPKNLIENNQIRYALHDTKSIRNLVSEKYFLINKNKTYIISIFIFLTFLFLIILIKKR